jgi:hypothetical protein
MAIRITYNTDETIDLEIGDMALDPGYGLAAEANQQRAMGGKIETIHLYSFSEPISFDAIYSEAVHKKLIAFWSWAEQGKTFSFAMNSDSVGNTTLDGAAAAAQKTIPLTATAAFAEDEYCLIRSAARTEYEIIQIDSISAGVSVTAVENLKFTYASGDTFRAWEYWPSLVIPDGEKYRPKKDGDHYFFGFTFLENF